MNRFFKSKSFKLFVIVIAALLLGSVIAGITHMGSTPLSSALGIITHPLQKISVSVGNYIDDYCIIRNFERMKSKMNLLNNHQFSEF